MAMAAKTIILFHMVFRSDWRENHAGIATDAALAEGDTFRRYYIPANIPDGFELEGYIDNEVMFELHYANNGQYFYFATYNLAAGLSVDTETASYDFGYRVNGWPAIVTENRGKTVIVWHDDVTYFSLETNLPLDAALNIAASYRLHENIF